MSSCRSGERRAQGRTPQRVANRRARIAAIIGAADILQLARHISTDTPTGEGGQDVGVRRGSKSARHDAANPTKAASLQKISICREAGQTDSGDPRASQAFAMRHSQSANLQVKDAPEPPERPALHTASRAVEVEQHGSTDRCDWHASTQELYPRVVDGCDQEGGVPSRLIKTKPSGILRRARCTEHVQRDQRYCCGECQDATDRNAPAKRVTG